MSKIFYQMLKLSILSKYGEKVFKTSMLLHNNSSDQLLFPKTENND